MIALTHEFMAVMLATRPPRVTDSLHVLEELRRIVSTRQFVTICDRKGLCVYRRVHSTPLRSR